MSSQDHSEAVVPEFNSLIGQNGIHIQDHIEDVQAIFYTDRTVEPKRASTEGFVYPVDSATEIIVTRLQTSSLVAIWIRDRDGNVVKEFDPNQGPTIVPPGDYLLEFTGMGMKIYATIQDSGFRANPNDGIVDIIFDPDTKVRIGARSFHSQPARTLRTTTDPQDLMHAVSLFGNAMKTWSPERTWPSLRGHPPLLEIGSTCEIPEDLTPPNTGITLSVPEEYDWLYPAAPLAYWLGATVEPGDPELTILGETYSLGIDGGYDGRDERKAFELHVKDVLQYSFLFDAAVRTEGFYDVELDARRRLEASEISLDYKDLYEEPLSRRMQTYFDLDIPFCRLSAHLSRPGWRLTADVQPRPDHASVMPFLARDLAVVRCPSDRQLESASQSADNFMEDVFSRTTPSQTTSPPSTSSGTLTRSSSSTSTDPLPQDTDRVIHLPETESMSQAWVGDGFAVGAAKASTASYLQRLENHAKGDSRISIDVIVNDDQMVDEADVSEIYGTRDHLDFDINLQQNLTSDELTDALERDTDFIHYIGHVDPEGFECTDGYLDAKQLGTVGADLFVLNACSSYKQGQHLVDNGAIAGVVTLEDVINSMATKIGRSIARLLNFGFPIGSATNLIQETMFSGSHYVVVGDSNATVTQSNMPVPNVARVKMSDDGRFEVTNELFASWNYDIGSMCRPSIATCECQYLVPGVSDTWTVNHSDLDDFLDMSTFPLIGAKNLYWSDEVSASSLRHALEKYE